MTTYLNTSPRCLSDRELIDRIRDLGCRERRATACLIAHLAELDERREGTPEKTSSEMACSECHPLPTAGHAIPEDRATNGPAATRKPHRATVVPLSPESYKLQRTIGPKTYQKLRQARGTEPAADARNGAGSSSTT